MFHQISYLRAILIRQAIPRCIGNIHHSRTCLDNSFYHPCQIFIIRSACIFGIELYIIHILTCILYGSHCTLYYFLAIGIEFIFNVRVRCTDASMDTFMLGKLQSLCCHINIFLYGTCQGTDGGPCHSFWYLNDRIEISRTWNRKSGFNHVHPQGFQLSGYLNLFHCIQLASRNLLAIAERCVENK